MAVATSFLQHLCPVGCGDRRRPWWIVGAEVRHLVASNKRNGKSETDGVSAIFWVLFNRLKSTSPGGETPDNIPLLDFLPISVYTFPPRRDIIKLCFFRAAQPSPMKNKCKLTIHNHSDSRLCSARCEAQSDGGTAEQKGCKFWQKK